MLESINNSLSFSKSDIGNNWHRYSIFVEKIDPENSPRIIIGEIDVIMIDEKKVEIKSAVYNIEETKEGIHILDDLYQMIYRKWKIAPISIEGFYDGYNVATETYIKIGIETGYHKLPGILSIMPESENDYWTEDIEKRAPSNSSEFLLSVSNAEREEIVEKYQFEINKGLTKIYRSNEQSGNTGDSSIIGNTYETIEEVPQQETNPWDQIAEGETLQKMVNISMRDYLHTR
jgi:hypothetical protein